MRFVSRWKREIAKGVSKEGSGNADVKRQAPSLIAAQSLWAGSQHSMDEAGGQLHSSPSATHTSADPSPRAEFPHITIHSLFHRMSGVELGLAIAGLVPACYDVGKKLVKTCRAARSTNSTLSDRANLIEQYWLRVEIQLPFVRDMENYLDDRQREVQCQALEFLLEKLRVVDSKLKGLIKTSTSHDGSTTVAYSKAKFAIHKSSLDEAISELDSRQRNFEATWFLMAVRRDTGINDQVKATSTKPSSSAKTLGPTPIETAKQLSRALTSDGSSAIIVDSSGLFQDSVTLIPFSTAKTARRRNAGKTKVLLAPVASTAGTYATTLKDIRNLAQRLKHADPFTFGLLECKAVLRDEDGIKQGAGNGTPSDVSNSLSFIFRIPPTHSDIQSVRGRLLQGPGSEHDSLSGRFALAQQLARAVFYVHFYEFVHKNIRPETILILGKTKKYGDLPEERILPEETAVLVGFDVIRNVDGKTRRVGDDNWEKDVYRHPNRQGRSPEVDYEMRHDIYSLGVCLLEIGLWESFVAYETVQKSEGAQTRMLGPGLETGDLSGPQLLENPQLFKEQLLSLARGRLRRQMGTKYSRVVETCLTCLDEGNVDFGDEKEFQDKDGVIVGATMFSITKECKSTRKETIAVHHHCPERPYIAITVPEDSKSVTSVEFTVISRDQGWVSHDKSASFTWFVAKANRPDGRPNLRVESLGNNRVANTEFHEQTWRLNLRGRPRRKVWIQSLLPGDEVQLIPKATFRGWVNIIREGSLKLTFESTEGQASSNEAAKQDNSRHYKRQLQVDEIRLLVVKPGLFGERISAKFLYTNLGEKPEFEALSYCWGDAPEEAEILMSSEKGDVDATPFRVKSSLAAALQRLRYETKPLIVWVDAVCIYQNDRDERSRQVAMMRRIYAAATSVRVWLGEESTGTQTALHVIRDIYNYNYPSCPGGDSCVCSGTKHYHTRCEIETRVRDFPGTSYRAMHSVFALHQANFTADQHDISGGVGNTQLSHLMSSLFLNPWFARVWVIQEATLAQEAFVHCSQEVVDWKEIISINQWLTDLDYFKQQPHIEGTTLMPPIWETLRQERIAREGSLVSRSLGEQVPFTGGREILDVLLDGMDLKASDPRDKLYALLPFGKETSIVERLDKAIKPDYNKSPETVFADFTRWWIHQHQSLAILSTIHCDSSRAWRRDATFLEPCGSPKHPTWALPERGVTKLARANLENHFNFRATEDTVPVVSSADFADPLVLQLQGLKVAEISILQHPTLKTLGWTVTGSKNSTSDIAEVFDRMFNTYGWTESRIPGTAHHRSKNGYRAEYMDHLNAHWGYFPGPLLLAVGVENDAAQWFETREVPPCLDPCFFVASNGMYGLCPWRAKKGDTIALLYGGKVPLLLRPTTQETPRSDTACFELVGECYVNGIMDGDYLKSEHAKTSTPITFALV
ncbi:hypothetical protein FDECE_9087 [Fusarium decemcellulare]|nr:hypothetical protein FDECE_9087 [Fusarium decemcellulare]